ncbi:hypothetical protein BT63DRAFT_421205 [Microthyrium microscopicum]|uniref:Uncharacterized protein n=1 Tax=Microthyrium microscopicum TaxID=703497 RepID=A0A6A6UL87_9PEZI|nr:hypothetical protein BT63DRAFT_421205 [Microthyrium microscopicum]
MPTVTRRLPGLAAITTRSIPSPHTSHQRASYQPTSWNAPCRRNYASIPETGGYGVYNNSSSPSMSLKEPTKDQFWLHAFQREYRLNPDAGISKTWQRLKKSGDDLPMQGQVANDIWRLLLNDVQLHEEAFDYARQVKSRSGILFDRLYEYTLEKRLALYTRKDQNGHEWILTWHEKFQQDYFIRPGALNALATVAKSSRSNLEIFRKIYKRGYCLPREGVYDLIVPDLCKWKEWQLALDWHFFLYSQKDFPHGSSFLKHTFKKRPTLEEALAEFLIKKDGGDLSAYHTNPKPFNPVPDVVDEETISGVEETHRYAPLSDEFCARLLATKGLTLQNIIKQLQVFGHSKLGSLALRELMARAGDIEEARDYLQQFKDANIVLGRTIYPRLVEQFIQQQQFDLLENLVQSDLHPDTLQDKQVQQKLLSFYHQQGDDLSSRRTIEIIKLLENRSAQNLLQAQGPLSQLTSNDLHMTKEFLECFDHLCHQKDTHQLQILIDDALIQSFCLSQDSVTALVDSDLIRSNLLFVSNLCVRMLKSGHGIPTELWQDVIRHLSWNRSHSANRLYHFFARQYYTRPFFARREDNLGSEHDRFTDPIGEILTQLPSNDSDNHWSQYKLGSLSSNLLDSGFKQGHRQLYSYNSSFENPAVVFLNNLRILTDLGRDGLPLHTQSIAQRLKLWLHFLYGNATSEQQTYRRIKVGNHFTLEELLLAIEEVWTKDRLFPAIYDYSQVEKVRDIEGLQEKINNPDNELDLESGAPELNVLGASESLSSELFEQAIEEMDPELVSLQAAIPDARPKASRIRAFHGGESDFDTPTRSGHAPNRIGLFKYVDFRELSRKNNGSVLDGLLHSTTQFGHPPLSREERIHRRIHLRFLILGHEPPPPSGEGSRFQFAEMTQEDWVKYIVNTSLMADKLLVQRGLC